MTRHHALLATTAIFSAWLPFTAHAQSLNTDPADLDEVVVTATRIPAIVAETPGARVIDAATIQQRGAIFAADILADVPGLSVVRAGAFGGVAAIRIRGASPGQTLTLVDGVPVNDPADISGSFDYSGFDLSDIERIEVLSGPQSSLWGSDAIGGVIAFTTRETDGLSADFEAGSFDTVRGRLAAGVAADDYALSGFVSRFSTDGISAADEADGNSEADGFESTTIGVKGRYAFGPVTTIDGSVRWSRTEADIDGFPAPAFALADTPDTTDRDQWSAHVRLQTQALGLNYQFSVSASDIERDTVSDFPSTFTADRQVYRWQADGTALSDQIDFAVGAEREETTGSLSTGAERDLGTTSVFTTAQYRPTDRLNLSGALRWDDTDDFGSETTGRVSAAYRLDGGFIASAAYGTGFKAPSVSQAVCDFCFAAVPFPVLRPETADSVEVALGWASSDGRIDGRITVYRLNIEDQISFFFDTVTFDSFYVNLAETRSDGIEVEGHADLGAGFDLALAYGWTDAENRITGERLLRVPEHAGSITLGWNSERLSGALTVRAEGDQNDAGGVRDSFVTANLNGAFQINDALALTVRIENLADEHYQQVFGYGEPGRSAYAGLRLRY